MNIDTGNIVRADALSADDMKRHIPIPDDELPAVRKLDKGQRKNWMRNKPCLCGSGKKFKRCCWGKI